MTQKFKKGFTLIELLVVISIIGVLSTIVLSSLNSARVKARDAKRVSDIRQLQSALELYYSNNGQYPNVQQATDSSTCDNPAILLDTYLVPSYLPKMLHDPLGPPSVYGVGTPYCYFYNVKNAGQGYVIMA